MRPALRWLRAAERAFLACLFLVMVALFFLNVLAREIGEPFSGSFAWAEEAVRLMNLFLVFGALGLALERGRHVGIDTLRRALPPRARRAVRKAIDATGLVFSLFLVYLGIQLIAFVLATGQRSPTLNLPMGWIYAAPVAGFALLALRYGLGLAGALDRETGRGAE